MSDIVERLRKWDTFWEDDLLVAADEIERLRAELAAERETTASLLRTIALIREAGKFTREDLDALPDAVKAMRQQRDELIAETHTKGASE